MHLLISFVKGVELTRHLNKLHSVGG